MEDLTFKKGEWCFKFWVQCFKHYYCVRGARSLPAPNTGFEIPMLEQSQLWSFLQKHPFTLYQIWKLTVLAFISWYESPDDRHHHGNTPVFMLLGLWLTKQRRVIDFFRPNNLLRSPTLTSSVLHATASRDWTQHKNDSLEWKPEQ